MVAAVNHYTYAELDALFRYEPTTGCVFWRVRPSPWSAVRAGDPADTSRRSGYPILTYRRRTLLAHRVAWLLMTRKWPRRDVDHRDLDRENNVWTNLRLATLSDNMGNVAPQRGRRFKGTSRSTSGKFYARLGHTPNGVYLGTFATEEAAARAYDVAALTKWGPYARLNFPN